MQKDIFEAMVDVWPSAVVARTSIDKFSGGMLSSKTMANFDSQGAGIKDRFSVGRKVCYPVDSLIEWMRARVKK
jgi:hypothetical protein